MTDVVDAISMAIARRKPKPGLVHHSDRGSQYTSIAMGRTLRVSRIMASMGSKGDPWDNARAESCISTIKNELVKRRTFTTRDQARLALFRYIESFYNPLRRHSSLTMLSPNDYEARYWEDNTAAVALGKPCQRNRGSLIRVEGERTTGLGGASAHLPPCGSLHRKCAPARAFP